MSLSDCPECWETPCRCGAQYKSWTVEELRYFINVLRKVKEDKINNPDKYCSKPDRYLKDRICGYPLPCMYHERKKWKQA